MFAQAAGTVQFQQSGGKANDVLVAHRQKQEGMSWSREGSVALAMVKNVKRRQELLTWLQDRRLLWQWVA